MIHPFRKRLTPELSNTGLVHIVAVGLSKKEARDCLRRRIRAAGAAIAEAWYASAETPCREVGRLARAEMLVRWGGAP